MKNFQQIGTEIGELVQVKNAAYGSSFAKCGEFMKLLYPAGIPAEKLQDALLLVRVFDKMMRIATDRDALGESPWADIIGYGILGVHLYQPKEEKTAPCKTTRDTASEDAESNAKAQRDSAAQPASEPTTTPASAPAASGPLPQPDGYSSEPESAPAPTATAAASASADASPNRCALCDEAWACAGSGHVVFLRVGDLDTELDYVLARRRS